MLPPVFFKSGTSRDFLLVLMNQLLDDYVKENSGATKMRLNDI